MQSALEAWGCGLKGGSQVQPSANRDKTNSSWRAEQMPEHLVMSSGDIVEVDFG